MLNNRLMPFILGVLILLLDQWTKYLVKTNLFYGESIPIIDGFFNLVFIKNDGAAWNIMSGQRLILVLISSLILLFLILKGYEFFSAKKIHRIAYGMLLGGISGNLVDRILTGKVIDFLDFQIGTYHYPSFNIADACICVAVILYFITSKNNKQNIK
jgi:signal peptidase II